MARYGLGLELGIATGNDYACVRVCPHGAANGLPALAVRFRGNRTRVDNRYVGESPEGNHDIVPLLEGAPQAASLREIQLASQRVKRNLWHLVGVLESISRSVPGRIYLNFTI